MAETAQHTSSGTKRRRPIDINCTLEPGDVGFRLIKMIIDKINSKNLTIAEGCEQMGVPETYFGKLRKKEALTKEMDSEYYRGIASFLDMPPLSVRVLGDQVPPSEFFRNGSDLPLHIDRAVEFITKDPDWMFIVPSSIHTADYQLKLLIIKLYEKASHTVLIDGQIDYQALITTIEELNKKNA